MADNRTIRIAEFASAVGLFLLGAGMPHILEHLHPSEVTTMAASVGCVVTGLVLLAHSFWRISRPEAPATPAPTSPPHPQPISYVNPYGGGPYMVFPAPSAQEKLAEIELKERNAEVEVRAFADVLCKWVAATKKRQNKTNLAFSEEILRAEALPGYGSAYLPAVLDMLRKQGRARQAGSPGWWFID